MSMETASDQASTTVAPSNRIDRFLRMMNDRGASDLHLSVGCAPIFRQSGQVDPIRFKQLTNRDWVSFIRPITPLEYWKEFLRLGDMDFAYEVEGLARFRVNLYMQERGYGAVFRIIPTELLTLQQLGLPKALKKIVTMQRGMVLVTGPTGSGKSTTLSAIINEINETRSLHIITIEDPIEFVHPNKKSIITQREVGPHTHSFADALRAAVREDPDLILVGEMRDLETIGLALHAAETGLLVFGTLHTNCAAKTVDRVVNVFPENEQSTVKNVLAETLQAVLAQQLLKKTGGGRCAAVEILFKTPALGTLIRDNKSFQITNLISTGKRAGMISMDASLWKLIDDGKVTPGDAFEKAIDKKMFKEQLDERGIALQ
jgi:twitching motility protein PilT